MKRWLPRITVRDWSHAYDQGTFTADLVAAVIVSIMLIPQSLAYAMLAGLPPQSGLYASVAPLLAYALFGTSRVLAVGPVAVVSLMTATAIGRVVPTGLDSPGGPEAYLAAALVLAALSGLILLVMGLLRLGTLAHFLSHPVISGFITASALLIAAGQLKVLMGVKAEGHNLPELIQALLGQLGNIHWTTFIVGVLCTVFLAWARKGLRPLLQRTGLSATAAAHLARTGPVVAIGLSILGAWLFGWAESGMKVVGHVPQGIPPFTIPPLDPVLWSQLALPALLISVVGFVESVSVGQTLAARQRQRIEPNQELVALGAGNLVAACSGGFPVTGGFARSVVNFDAGARTPAAGVYTAVGLLAASLFLTPLLFHLPQTTLAATIIVAVLSLVDFSVLGRTWRQSRPDFIAVVATLAGTLLMGVEQGLVAGVGVSLALHLWHSSRPHIAEVGLVPGTEHFRNVLRHSVQCSPQLVSLRVDESLYFANARSLEDRINDTVASRPALRHVVLLCSAINDIDASAVESLEAIDLRLREAGLMLHLSEVKGPVMDRLGRTGFPAQLSGQIFLSHFQAITTLAPDTLQAPLPAPPPA